MMRCGYGTTGCVRTDVVADGVVFNGWERARWVGKGVCVSSHVAPFRSVLINAGRFVR